tara:strand:- start:518 stop:769 length:252 start_codon:yes stop_codon:yes gene_type:complete
VFIKELNSKENAGRCDEQKVPDFLPRKNSKLNQTSASCAIWDRCDKARCSDIIASSGERAHTIQLRDKKKGSFSAVYVEIDKV